MIFIYRLILPDLIQSVVVDTLRMCICRTTHLARILCLYTACTHIILRFVKISANMNVLNEENNISYIASHQWHQRYSKIIQDHNEIFEVIGYVMDIFTPFLFMEYFIQVYSLAYLCYASVVLSVSCINVISKGFNNLIYIYLLNICR